MTVALSLLTCILHFSFGQKHEVSALWEVPLQFGIGYRYHIIPQLSADVQGGVLTDPNSGIILTVLEGVGIDETTVSMIENAFKSGYVVKGRVNYHVGKFYFGAFVMNLHATGKDTPYEIIGEVMDVDMDSYPRRRNRTTESTLTLNTNLLQAGISIGRDFILKKNMAIFTELSASMNIGSSSSLKSEERDFSQLSAEVDTYLADLYKTYAYIPTLSIGWKKKF